MPTRQKRIAAMDEDLLERVREIAEVPTTEETPGVAADSLFDDMILIARSIVKREAHVDAA
jgi:hypothetical protein